MEGTIYKITGGGLTYYGSTSQELKARFNGHKMAYKLYKNGKGKFVSSCKVMEHNDARIEAVEHVVYNTKRELFDRERFFIVNNQCVNINKPMGGIKGSGYSVFDIYKIIENNSEYFRKKQGANPKYKIEMDF
jgi:hypothetical protein